VQDSNGRKGPKMLNTRPILNQRALRQQAGALNEREQAMFKLLNTNIAQGYRNALRIEQKAVVVEHALDRLHLGIIILSPLGKVRVITQAAVQQIRTYFTDSASRGKCLPGGLSKWVKTQEIASPAEETETPETRELVLQHNGTRLVIRAVFSADQTVLLLEEHPPKIQAEPRVTSPLSPRQVDVVTWLSQGKTNNEIGLILKLSPRTVQKHLEHIYRKLGVENRTGAAAKAYEFGWTASKQNFFFVPICSLISQLYGLF
jgi:DNA-binding CsgD family transcriptional regulator